MAQVDYVIVPPENREMQMYAAVGVPSGEPNPLAAKRLPASVNARPYGTGKAVYAVSRRS